MGIIDVHNHTPRWKTPPEHENTSMNALWRPDQAASTAHTWDQHLIALEPIERAIVFNMASDPRNGEPDDGNLIYPARQANDDTAAFVRAYPEKFLGFLTVHPFDPNALDEIERATGDLGLRGIKLGPNYQNFDPLGPEAFRVFKRAEELGLPTTLRDARPFLHVSGRFGAARGCIAVMAPLAMHPTNKNELLAWDLAADPSELADLKPDALRARLFTASADLPEGVTRLPIKGVHLNKSPIVIGNLKTLRPGLAERWGIDFGAAQANFERLRALPDLSALWPQVYARPAAAEPVDVDEDLYGGFLGDADRRRLERLRTLDARELALARAGFDDERLAELLWRYRARNFPDTLTTQERARWEARRARRLLDGADGALTVQGLFDRIDALAESDLDERQQAVLGALYEWAEQIAPTPD